MDPTIPQMPGQNAMAASGPEQNALMLALLKNSGAGPGGMGQPPAPQTPPMGSPPMAGGPMPVDPSTMTGGLGDQATQQQAMGQIPLSQMSMLAQQAQPPNPVTNALMSPIPGGQ